MRFQMLLPILMLNILVGCSEKPEGSDSKYVDTLMVKASVVGREDLARFNAADLLYKNIPELHTTVVPIIERQRHVWVKTYRVFTDFDVVDIKQSQSLLSPIIYSIKFNYEQFATPYRATDEQENALELSEKDTQYEFRLSDSFIRYYSCNKDGDLVNPVPTLPRRADYFALSYDNEAELGTSPD